MRKTVLLTVVGVTVVSTLMLPGAAEGSHDPSGAPFTEDFATGTQFTFCDPFAGCFTETDTLTPTVDPWARTPGAASRSPLTGFSKPGG
jgi:hypothetical protein